MAADNMLSPVLQGLTGRAPVTPHFIPTSFSEGALVTVALRRLQGMLFIESEHSGSISQADFLSEIRKLVPYVDRVMSSSSQPSLPEPGADNPQSLPITDAAEATTLILKRALGTVLAVNQDPNNPAHRIEKKSSLAAAHQQGYGTGTSASI